MGTPHSAGPASHIVVHRAREADDASVWQRRGMRLVVGLAGLSFVSWWFGWTAAGAAITAGVIAFLLLPSTRSRLTNSVSARRDGRWVSPPLALGERHPVLLTIDDQGLEVLDGDTYGRGDQDPVAARWEGIEQIHLAGPPGRPTGLRILGAGVDLPLAGPFPASVLDELARFGVAIPDAHQP